LNQIVIILKPEQVLVYVYNTDTSTLIHAWILIW